MAVPKKRVSRTRKNLRHTNWKKDLIPQALKALSLGKSNQFSQMKPEVPQDEPPKTES